MNFGEALDHIEKGGKIAREGWNGKGLFVYYIAADKHKASHNEQSAMIDYADDHGLFQHNAYMAIKNTDGTVSTWVPSINDCLAKDWVLLD